ncbi:MAG: hypothetical protein JXQ65_10185 [Candidatus Marinimicrobia bacterium]|nr:hypothetical protein [Candidatus Neomarinimicrobiota bacterium]
MISKTKQEIFEHFKKEDPAGWKILRNISEAPKRNKNISVNSDYGSIYFYIKGGTFPEDYAPEKPSIESEQLDLWISKVVKKTSTTPAIIEKILKSLQSQDHYKKFLSREMIFKSMCVVLAYSTIALHEDYGFYENYLTVINKETLMKAIADIIEEKYLISGKISSEEQTLYKKILNQYFSDLVEDGFTEKLTWYLKEFSNGIKIKQKQINQIEYIIKIGKKYLRQCVN